MEQTEAFSLIEHAARKVTAQKGKPATIAVNGIEGTGKTTFAANLVEHLNEQGIPAFHVSIDGFHFNKSVRYRQGRSSADGYYEDAYDEAALVTHVLQSSQGQYPSYVQATHDLQSDEYLELKPTEIPNDAMLVTDGCYLFKPIFNPHWDVRVYLKTDFETALNRGAARDQEHLGGHQEAKHRIASRYHVASRRYISEVDPESRADLIFDNTDFSDLVLISTQ